MYSMLSQNDLDTEVLSNFVLLSRFGATPAGGVDRESLTSADVEQRAWFAALLKGRGFSVEIDKIGNQFGLLTWAPGQPYLLLGSHLDSQPLGGRFDGAYGVIAAAEAAWRLKRQFEENGQFPKYNLAVVNWFNEEGSRFRPSMMGSSVYTGKMDVENALSTTDMSGTTVGEALGASGSLGRGDGASAIAYAEVHIEQGRHLDEEGVSIGLVEATWAARKYQVTVYGEQSHTGSTVMNDRQDALLGAAQLVVAVRDLADSFAPDMHTSVAQFSVSPNSPVVVAREVRLHLDMRSPAGDLVERADARLNERVVEIERMANVQIKKELTHSWGLSPYDPRGVELAEEAAEELGLSHQRMMTIAGHDSTNVKDIVPTVMLFIPSVDGISHNEGEYTRDVDICSGVNLLTRVAERLLDGGLDS